MSITEACLAILAALIFVGTLVFAAIQPAIEAEQFNQCTGSNAKVNIQLAYRKSDQDIGAYAFWYNLTDYSCTFEKYVYGATKESKRYENLSDMLEFLRDTDE